MTVCTRVRPGWYCNGEDGHDGPCAAWPPCHFCGWLGPGLNYLEPMSSICNGCISDLGIGPADPGTNYRLHDKSLVRRIRRRLRWWLR